MPGPDSVGERALKGLPGMTINALLEIINTVMQLEHSPIKWRTVDLLMAQKVDKDEGLLGS